jgi:hypothetical protein
MGRLRNKTDSEDAEGGGTRKDKISSKREKIDR